MHTSVGTSLAGFVVALMLLAGMGCESNSSPASPDQQYGAPVDIGQALPASHVLGQAAAFANQGIVLEGRITEVCQNQGCWLALDNGAGAPLRVDVARTADDAYAFTVPTDLHGWAVVQGRFAEMTTDAHHGPTRETDTSADDSSSMPTYHIVASGIRVLPADV